jgi:hypothetical protein
MAPVLDCYNGEIVGLAMDNNMKKELVPDSVECRKRRNAPDIAE